MNPFAAFEEQDDDDFQPAPTQQKPPKKTHQERKVAKQQKMQQAERNAKGPQASSANENIPEKVKDNPRNKRYHEIVPPKQVPATGHYLDRRSGTGRNDRPRKEGGGRGNVGNLKDELNKDKYVKEEGQEQAEDPEAQEPKEEKPQEPEAKTLDEYYREKGVDVAGLEPKREPVKKGEINADWIQKEKLTVMETKEDKRQRQQANVTRKDLKNKVGFGDNTNAEILGFGSQPQKKERDDQREQRGRGPKDQGKGRKQEKVVLKEDDFPSL